MCLVFSLKEREIDREREKLIINGAGILPGRVCILVRFETDCCSFMTYLPDINETIFWMSWNLRLRLRFTKTRI